MWAASRYAPGSAASASCMNSWCVPGPLPESDPAPSSTPPLGSQSAQRAVIHSDGQTAADVHALISKARDSLQHHAVTSCLDAQVGGRMMTKPRTCVPRLSTTKVGEGARRWRACDVG